MAKKDSLKYSKVLMALSVIAILLSAVGYIGFDFWLASTQWLLISTIFAVFGLYLKQS